ncbi:MAG: hypothetical protein H0X66_16325 [Verrucomicrobia bacterium]|nr:hypothetical protein [Verrucomicrobiota bacterium]
MNTKLLLATGMLLLASMQASEAQVTYRIFATREGLVGGTTANGHIIKTRDKFVALPSRRGLNANDSTYTYTVNLYNPANGKRKNGVPVWDVGPWNTKDDYWNIDREMWKDLPRGKPEAQAAYQNGYNGGKDQFGRTVLNPAGIDLADGTFWDDMGMVNNGWIDVTFNWVSAGSTIIVDNSASGFNASANWATATSSTDKYGTNYRYRSATPVSDQATWSVSLPSTKTYTVSAWWPQGSNRSQTAPYIVYHSGGTTTKSVNQQINGGKWNSLGSFTMSGGANQVRLSCWTTTGFVVMADAIRWQ